MFHKIKNIYNTIVIENPMVVLATMVCIFVFFAYHIKDFRLDASADSLLLEDDEDLRMFRNLIDRYRAREFLFVTFTPDDDLFSDNSLRQIKSLRDELNELSAVSSVISIIDVPLVKQVEGTLAEVARNYRTLESPDVDRERAKRELMDSPVFSEMVISADGQTTALQINLVDHPEFRELQKRRNSLLLAQRKGELLSGQEQELAQVLEWYQSRKKELAEQNHETIMKVRNIMEPYRHYGTLHLGGVPMITDDMITYIKNDLVVFGFGVFAFLVIMLSIIFRRKRWVILPLVSCTYAGLLMMGLLGLIGWQVTVISSNFISLMLISTMAMNIHLVVRYRQLRNDHPDNSQRELVSEMTGKMIWPCLYTALTTILAFMSLVVSDIKPVIDFGWMMTMGLSVTFATSFLLFPSLLMLMQKTDTMPTERKFQFTSLLAKITEHHGEKVIGIAIMFAMASLYGISRLEVENSFINFFSDETEIYQGLKLIDEKLGGTTPLDILIKFPEDEPVVEEDSEFDLIFESFDTGNEEDYWFTPQKVEKIEKVHDYLANQDAVGKVLSLASLIKVGEDVNKGKFDAFELAIVNKRMPEELKESMIDPYISIADDEARINIRIKDSLPDLRRNELLQRIDRGLNNRLGLEKDEYQITGLLVLYNNMLQSLFSSQIETLGVVMAGIALMLLLLFRSISLAVIGIIPNLLAATIILGLMGILGIPLDMMTITIAAITIGIAVDNSIHYIYRFREEYARIGDYTKTLHYCHANIGNAVFYTAITIIIGFSILVLSNFIPTIYFGVLTALAMSIALLAALTLLPKLILWWRPF
ncbi:MAG: MMPL family transporter [Gammaproteobacteria bacterium]|nr:MMPL family transporter [Gammaproteobacteria bacterium]NIN62825.1 MMPL family transporter [Gammaproteobacteria bacterium]NIO63806.1 MMPL family transporter [Gammaproteobacteria bacterium]NIP50184.1 MMPL family transporter [Gammaproteobacteria bacterium]NIQ12402.1 MMPL family transporter [Gammaproteobacteria bacterium]